MKAGEDFGELAKRFSDGSTAKQGGDLGTFERGQLATNLEDAVFKLKRNRRDRRHSDEDRILDSSGREHYPAGQQPEDKVETEINNQLYDEKMKPALREYLDNCCAKTVTSR